MKSPSQCATWTENDLGQANCIAASKLGESSAIGRRSGEGGNASDGPEIRDWHNILDPPGSGQPPHDGQHHEFQYYCHTDRRNGWRVSTGREYIRQYVHSYGTHALSHRLNLDDRDPPPPLGPHETTSLVAFVRSPTCCGKEGH